MTTVTLITTLHMNLCVAALIVHLLELATNQSKDVLSSVHLYKKLFGPDSGLKFGWGSVEWDLGIRVEMGFHLVECKCYS